VQGAVADPREADPVAGEEALRLRPLESQEFDVNVIDTSGTVFAFRVIGHGMPLQVNDEACMADLTERVSRAYAEDGYRYRLAVDETLREASSYEAVSVEHIRKIIAEDLEDLQKFADTVFNLAGR